MKLAALLGALATYTHTHTQAEVIHRTMFGLLHPLVALATVYHCFVQARIHYQTRQLTPNTMECALRAPPPATATRALSYKPSTPLSRRTARALHTRIAIRKAMRCAARRRVGTNRRSVTLSVDHDETISVITVAMTLGRLSVLEQFE